jgi:glycerol-3-phosphate cytidylyltransferase-like family protein
LDETEEIVFNLKTQLEHAKEVEEALKIQLTKKEETCHKLKSEIINLKKINEYSNTNLKIQLKEAKKNLEAQRMKSSKREELCHMLKLEIVNLKKLNGNTIKTINFHNSSAILDKIWNIQRLVDDKIGHGYNKK